MRRVSKPLINLPLSMYQPLEALCSALRFDGEDKRYFVEEVKSLAESTLSEIADRVSAEKQEQLPWISSEDQRISDAQVAAVRRDHATHIKRKLSGLGGKKRPR